jgi:predicted amidophosphoribosyltransferase
MLSDHLPKGFSCVGCARTTWKTICDSCKETLQWNQTYLPSPICELQAIAPLMFSYSRSQALIRQYKEHGGIDLRRALFRMPHPLLHQLTETHFFGVVPIPQDQERSFRRGHESALSTARFFANQLSLPVLPILKLKNKKTKRLTGLTKAEREWAENPFAFCEDSSFCFELFREKMNSGREIRLLLIDDLITSGSTLAKACDTLITYYPKSKIWGGGIGFRPHRRFH